MPTSITLTPVGTTATDASIKDRLKDAGKALTDPGTLGNAATGGIVGLGTGLSAGTDLLNALGKRSTWNRAGMVIGGGVLIVMGFIWLGKKQVANAVLSTSELAGGLPGAVLAKGAKAVKRGK